MSLWVPNKKVALLFRTFCQWWMILLKITAVFRLRKLGHAPILVFLNPRQALSSHPCQQYVHEMYLKTTCCCNRIIKMYIHVRGHSITTWNKFYTIVDILCNTYSPSQSAPTILVFKTWVGLWPWKKKVQNMGCKKHGAKKQSHCYTKREEAI